jgi:(2Fe-2S) ferredoxin
MVCRGPECGDKRHSGDVHAQLQVELAARAPDGHEVALDQYSCFGRCQRGVNVLVREVKPGENTRLLLLMPTASASAFLYHKVEPAEARRIVEEHIAQGRPILEFTRRR